MPLMVSQGGDHTITLPLLRGVAEVYGPVRYVSLVSSSSSRTEIALIFQSVIHFDSHIGMCLFHEAVSSFTVFCRHLEAETNGW